MTAPSKTLQTFPNPNPERDYEIAFEAPEFTCLCPMTGQPDFATIRIRYTPDAKCVELKSLKLATRERFTRRSRIASPTISSPRSIRDSSKWKATSTCAAASRRK
jgi:7-cyano-7-deazaguanine reductase